MLPTIEQIDADELIFEHFSYADFVDGNANYVDEFLGIGKRDKLKKAEKKQAKAEKQLEKGHIKAAERKGKKAEKLFTQYKTAQDKLIANQETKKAIGANKDVLNATDPIQTESPSTTAGQIGEVAGAMSSVGSSGGTSGGAGGGDMPYYPDASNPIPEDAGFTEGDPNNPKELEGVTVVGHPKEKSNTVVLIIAGIIVLALVYFFFIRKRK